MNEKIFWFWLSMVLDTETEIINLLLEYFESPYNIFYTKEIDLVHAGVSEKRAGFMVSNRNEREILKKYGEMEKKGIRMSCFGDDGFPDFSCMGNKQPRIIYYLGKMPPAKENCVSIIGARNCSLYGKSMAMTLGREAAECGISVISGMALGTDAGGHKGALDGGGDTYAVLGSGVDVCYPPSERQLYERIKERGGILSEYVPGTPPDRWRFPLRNRIISGLSDKIIVVEAKEKSGSLITVEYGLEQGKDIYAVPGRATDELSKGCNELIKNGAGMVTCINDVFPAEYILPDRRKKYDDSRDDILKKMYGDKVNKKEKINIRLEKHLRVVYSNVDLAPKHLEEIATKCSMTTNEVLHCLTELQIKGLVREDIKNYYSKI